MDRMPGHQADGLCGVGLLETPRPARPEAASSSPAEVLRHTSYPPAYLHPSLCLTPAASLLRDLRPCLCDGDPVQAPGIKWDSACMRRLSVGSLWNHCLRCLNMLAQLESQVWPAASPLKAPCAWPQIRDDTGQPGIP